MNPRSAMKLYGYYRSSASYRIRIMLNFKGLEREDVPVALNRDEHLGAAFAAVNPARLVPVLECGTALVGQSPAIAEYLEERYPEPALLPEDPARRAEVREMQSLIGCDVHPLQNLRVLRYLRTEFDQGEAAVLAWCRKWIGDGFAAFEALASRRSANGCYAVGDAFSLADVWLVPQVYNADRFEVDLAPYPTLRAIAAHCAALEAVAAAHPARQPDAPA